MTLDIQYTHDGLTQYTTMSYDLIDLKRTRVNKKYNFTRYVYLHLPLFLTIPLWIRHGYSILDIQATLEYFSSIHLWQCALLLGAPASNSAIKVSFATPDSMVYGSKAIAIRKIKKILQANFDFPSHGNILDTVRDEHVPPLPVHVVNAEIYNNMLSAIPEHVNMLGTISFDIFFNWNDIQIVPMWVEKDALYCVRIIDRVIFDASNRVQTPSLSNRPLDILVGKNKFAGVEEAMFFVRECD